MLFAPIKTHALLFRFRRELFTTATGGENIWATTEEDIAAAARLYREFPTNGQGATLAEWRQFCSSMEAPAAKIKPGHSNRMVHI